MATAQIPNLPLAISLTGTEELEIVQPPGSGGTSKKTTTGAIAGLYNAPIVSAEYVLLTANPLLTQSRELTASSNVTVTDGGPQGPVTLDLSATGVVAGAYISANVTVDDKGRVTAISNGAAGTVTSVSAGTGITITGTAADPVVNITNTSVAAGTYGSATKSLQATFNAQGQATAATEVLITPAASSITGTLGVDHGGTGVASLTDTAVLIGNGTGAVQFATPGTAGVALVSAGPGVDPAFGAVSLTAGVSGVLPIANGGTNASTAADALVSLGASTSVANLAALKALTTRPALVTMDGYTTAGDGGGGLFWWDNGSATAANDGTVVQCTTGPSGRYKRIYSGSVNVRWFGAVGNGVTDDLVPINAAAVAAQSPNGGSVFLPPSGNAYVISDTVNVPNGVKLQGVGTFRFPGATAANSQWTQEGSWLTPTNAVNPGVTLTGHGSAIEGVNFIYNQTPPSGSFTPTQYGMSIRVEASHTTIDNVRIVNGYDGIEFAYTALAGGGTNVWMRDVIVSAFNVRLRTSCVNDTMYWSDIHCRNLWYSSDSDVVDYIRANTVGWDCGYTDNVMVDGLEFFEDRGIFFRDETCLGNTHSLFNGTLNNVQFNLPQRSMEVENGTTSVRAYFGTVVAQQGNAFGLTWADTVFTLASNNINISFGELTVVDAGGVVFDLGAGAGGIVSVAKLDIQNYSSIIAGQVGIAMAASARFEAGSVVNFFKNTSPGAGARIAGAGSELYDSAKYQSWQVYSTFFQLTATGTGSYADASTGLFSRPGIGRYYQARITGNINVTAASGGTTMSFKLSGIPQCEITGIPTAATGFQNFDTGWVDLTEAQLSALGTVGRLQHNTNAAVTWQSGEITVLFR